MRKNCCTKKKSIDYDFDAAWTRLQTAIGASKQEAIAAAINVTQPSVSWGFNQRRIPDKWLLHLLRTKLINPDWILYGAPYCKWLSYGKVVNQGSPHQEKSSQVGITTQEQEKNFELVLESFSNLPSN